MNPLFEIARGIRHAKQNQSELHALKRAFSTVDGKIALNSLIKTYVIPSAFSDNDRRMAWMDGQRSLVLQLARTIYGPDAFAEQIRNLTEQQQIDNSNG
jgi:hypothetical protein